MSTDQLSRRIAYVAVPIAGGVAVAAAMGVAGAAPGASGTGSAHAATSTALATEPPGTAHAPTGEPATYTTATRTAEPVSAAAAQQQVVRGLGPDVVESIKAAPGASGGAITVQLAHNDGGLADEWLANLAAGAYAELSHTDQPAYSAMLQSAHAVGPNARGKVTTTPLGAGAASFGQRFGSPSDAALRARVDDVAKEFGLDVADVQVLHPLESALKVRLVVPDGKVGWRIGQLATALEGGQHPDVEGSFIELDAPDGHPLLRTSAAYRTGGGSLWFAPGQDDRFGAVYAPGPWG